MGNKEAKLQIIQAWYDIGKSTNETQQKELWKKLLNGGIQPEIVVNELKNAGLKSMSKENYYLYVQLILEVLKHSIYNNRLSNL